VVLVLVCGGWGEKSKDILVIAFFFLLLKGIIFAIGILGISVIVESTLASGGVWAGVGSGGGPARHLYGCCDDMEVVVEVVDEEDWRRTSRTSRDDRRGRELEWGWESFGFKRRQAHQRA
jgi:hypothetical protein